MPGGPARALVCRAERCGTAAGFCTWLIDVLPLVIGARGCLPKNAIDTLSELDISDRGTYTRIALMALRHSIEIYHSFMDYNVPVT
jgi:hypothetical protein